MYILWDENASEWAPQNHSCNANTHYIGLNVVASTNIAKDEELTLDYATFLNDKAQEFECKCGAANCRKLIKANPENSIEFRL